MDDCNLDYIKKKLGKREREGGGGKKTNCSGVGDIEIWVTFVSEISTKKKYWFQN